MDVVFLCVDECYIYISVLKLYIYILCILNVYINRYYIEGKERARIL